MSRSYKSPAAYMLRVHFHIIGYANHSELMLLEALDA